MREKKEKITNDIINKKIDSLKAKIDSMKNKPL